MMVTALRTLNMNITVMIVKWKYIRVGIHVLMIVRQKNSFLVLHMEKGITHNVDSAPEINCTSIYRSRIQEAYIINSFFLAFMFLHPTKKKVRNAKHNQIN